MQKYLFLSDIDGTLLRNESGISPAVKIAAQRFANAGGLLTLCTGRSYLSTKWVAQEMNINIPCILLTGAMLYDFSVSSSVWTCPLDKGIMKHVQFVYDNYPQISIQVYTHDQIIQMRMNNLLKTNGIPQEKLGEIIKAPQPTTDILKIVLVCEDVPLLKRCGEEVFGANGYQFAFASKHFSEVVSPDAGKAIAMKALAQHMGVELCNTFAAGDGMTDLPMLELAGYSFAPVDGAQAVLAACDMYIPTCEEGGVAVALNWATDHIEKQK